MKIGFNAGSNINLSSQNPSNKLGFAAITRLHTNDQGAIQIFKNILAQTGNPLKNIVRNDGFVDVEHIYPLKQNHIDTFRSFASMSVPRTVKLTELEK